MAHYVIMKCDLTRPFDEEVTRRVNRTAAERLVRQYNEDAIARKAGLVHLAELFYCERSDLRMDRSKGKEATE